MSEFWQRWVTAWCGIVALFGIVIAGAAFDMTDGPVRLFFGLLNEPLDLAVDDHLRFSLAVLGAVTLGWSITLLAAFRAALRLGIPQSRPVWKLLAVSLIVWYLVDSALSVATGFWSNAALNTVLLAAFLVPILRGGDGGT